MKKTLTYIIIIFLVGTLISPTILGLVKEKQKIFKKIGSEPEYFDLKNQENYQRMEKICRFYNLQYEKLLFDDESPLFFGGLWDFTIKGYITDDTNDDPIKDAEILIIWIGRHLSFDRDTTTTDSTGYFEINLENIFYGEIIYFVRAEGYYSYQDLPRILFNEGDIWLNASLSPGAPPKNSIVNGFVLNADNADPIEEAIVDINWVDNNGHGDWLFVVTDEYGFFDAYVPAGEVMPWVYADGYYENYKQEKEIGEGKALEFIIPLHARYPDSAMICGYVTEEQTGDPIEKVSVELMSDNMDKGHIDWNYTFTDPSGYYEINVADSDFQIQAYSYMHANDWSHNDHIEKGEIYWWNTSLYKIPPQTSMVCGYINDLNSDDPIYRADIMLYWDEGYHYRKYTVTDDLGFYKIKSPPGNISLRVGVSDYYDFALDDYLINDNETLWLNISLEPYPPANSVIEGFIKSNKSSPVPIKGAYVIAHSFDENGDFNGGNHTKTDKSGYYKMDVAAGDVNLYLDADGHYNMQTEKFSIKEGETLKVDVLLKPVKLNINVEKPIRGIYWNNKLLVPFIFTIILGDIDIKVNGSYELREVEFYVDDEFKHADRFEPYDYSWTEGGFGLHKIKLVCNGIYETVVYRNINVLRLI